MMEQAGIDDEDLLEAWRQGKLSRRDLYVGVSAPMRQAARRGIRSITSSDPDPHEVDDSVAQAFLELEGREPMEVTSLVGFAVRIAFRRGQDSGRRTIREREQMRSMINHLGITADPQFHDDDMCEAAEREVLLGHALRCMAGLTDEQLDIVRTTIMESESLSDWALRAGKSHQSASRQRTRALESLRRCVRSKTSTAGGNDESR
ncbi:hypothetical protein [Streptomyces sp. NPDC050263]|uniref:RNA polymerase sigma factor n=1 Tax=Streptomyces sp. NPDC050263 TaxID=3155037 RepID=UPI00341AAAAC